MMDVIKQLYEQGNASRDDLKALLMQFEDEGIRNKLHQYARNRADEVYGKNIYIRGLVEFSNYCKNDCYYCGISRSNIHASRYRLNEEQIMSCLKEGYRLGFRSFVLQSGEDPYFDDDKLCHIITMIKANYPDCALTLSIGEKEYESYQRYKEAGVDRYLLRHETSNETHYGKLHPSEMSLAHRKKCLLDLKALGYQVGCGIMIGSPYQTIDNLVDDLIFMKEFKPHMIGMGPFIPHHDTRFKDQLAGSIEMSLMMLSIVRLMHPHVLLPATTALQTLDPMGREKGIMAGCNVIMPNLSPMDVKAKYTLYDNKACVNDSPGKCQKCLDMRLDKIGYQIVIDRGDYKE